MFAHPGYGFDFQTAIHTTHSFAISPPGQMYIVPKGVEHRPVAKEEVHLLLIEPTGTPNTGDVKTAAPRKTA
jgi:mannose-6-phosphate isomerase-like protein (cupin superfamily)